MSISVGIDVSKASLSVYHAGISSTIDNEAAAITAYFSELPQDSRIVLEATGKYHRVAHQVLESMGFPVMVINPHQSYHFKQMVKVRCKTDAVDAKLLSDYGDTSQFETTLCMEEDAEALQELSRHLDDLKRLKEDVLNRIGESKGFVKGSLEKVLGGIKTQIEDAEKQLSKRIMSDALLKRRLELLCSIPGIGAGTGMMLLSCLKELGTLDKRAIASLTGLAPLNNDSGKFNGKRRIHGGRHHVRQNLYMPIVGASTQHNARLKKFYEAKVAEGKEKKVILTACMRKLVVWANAILASDEPWQELCT